MVQQKIDAGRRRTPRRVPQWHDEGLALGEKLGHCRKRTHKRFRCDSWVHSKCTPRGNWDVAQTMCVLVLARSSQARALT